jgi:hypothetical protein
MVRSVTVMGASAAVMARRSPSSYHTRKKMTVKRAEARMMHTRLVTTAEVVACPTAAALRPHCMPRRQPAKATNRP